MFQKLTVIGNLGNDPEMRYTPTGQQVTTFSVAASEKWTGQDNQLHERTVWFRATAWGKTAETCNTYLKKGSKVYIEGRLTADEKGSPRLFTRKDGTMGASFEVTVTTIKFLSPKNSGEAGPASGGGHAGEPEPIGDEADIPF